MSTAMKDVVGRIEAKSARLVALFDKKTPDGRLDVTDDERHEMKALNDELTDLGKERDRLRDDHESERAARDAYKSSRTLVDDVPFAGSDGSSGGERRQAAIKSLGQRFVDDDAFKTFRPGQGRTVFVEVPDIDLAGAVKTALTTSGGFAPYSPRTDVVVPYALRRPVVADLIPQDGTTSAQIIYMEQTTNTMNAASVAENAQKPESAFAWTQRSQVVEVIATTLPVTNQQLADVPQIRGVVDNLMTLDLMLAEEVEILTGTGSTPHLQGILTKSGIQTQAKGADPTPSAIYKAMTKVRFTGFAEPTGVVIHPNDWQDVKLLQDLNGNYIWGKPSDEGPDRIWGLPVIVTTAETEGTALVGDFRRYTHISRRQGITIDAGYVGSDFQYNRMTLRAEERLSLEILRAAAFATITGV